MNLLVSAVNIAEAEAAAAAEAVLVHWRGEWWVALPMHQRTKHEKKRAHPLGSFLCWVQLTILIVMHNFYLQKERHFAKWFNFNIFFFFGIVLYSYCWSWLVGWRLLLTVVTIEKRVGKRWKIWGERRKRIFVSFCLWDLEGGWVTKTKCGGVWIERWSWISIASLVFIGCWWWSVFFSMYVLEDDNNHI